MHRCRFKSILYIDWYAEFPILILGFFFNNFSDEFLIWFEIKLRSYCYLDWKMANIRTVSEAWKCIKLRSPLCFSFSFMLCWRKHFSLFHWSMHLCGRRQCYFRYHTRVKCTEPRGVKRITRPNLQRIKRPSSERTFTKSTTKTKKHQKQQSERDTKRQSE